ncbi:thioredoxin family protein [Aureibaculum sp. 2210JD6-5]|uniref:thioredoxin family protein n=1 Tax=Aureibaculum sp. 2210JD6-5 TaxID=3103957 RepID=UPI002AAE8215|nr:thioredoxin family protein [Aureibaculum sp. 2210JD6-5]MDY7396157.1 thioredoxin family protein [Aureibaculum sp. 2210JD6-5]
MKKIANYILILILILSSNIVKADNWLYSLEDAQKLAIATNKLILVDFWASWCGPCHRMDSESWSKEEVKIVMDNYVSVQIDIDTHRSLARKYGVKGIPFVFILDANGEVVYKQMSYMGKSKVIKLLEKYALSTKFLQTDYLIYNKKVNSYSAFRLAQKYQDFAMFLDDDIKTDFLSLSKIYIKQTEKELKNEDREDKAIEEKIELLDIQEDVIRDNYKRSSKALGKLKEEEINDKNKQFFYFLNYVSCRGQNKSEMAETWLTKLKSTKRFENYLTKAEQLFKEES